MSTWTVRSTLNWAHDHLSRNAIDEARLTAEMLLAHVLGQDRFRLYLQPDLSLDNDQHSDFRKLVKKRSQGVPLQHLLGTVSFMGYNLNVTRDVLIPRFETEELVERSLKRLPDPSLSAPVSFLDAGTGSGAIAIALAKLRPDVRGVASDISAEALSIAKTNAQLNSVADRVEFAQSDWLKNISGAFDIVVANPPYIASGEIQSLAIEVQHHDPLLALDGGTDGLGAVRILARQACAKLKPGGWLLLEIGQGQSQEAQLALADVGYKAISVYADLSGVERIVEAQWEGGTCPE